MSVSFIDVVFFIVVIVFTFSACYKGFIREVFGKGSFACGILCAIIFTSKLSPFIEPVVKNQIAAIMLASVLIFIAAYLAIKIIEIIVNSIFSGEVFRSLDRALGFLLGIAEGLVVVCIILIIIKAQPWFELDIVTRDSLFWKYLGSFLSKPVSSVGGYLS